MFPTKGSDAKLNRNLQADIRLQHILHIAGWQTARVFINWKESSARFSSWVILLEWKGRLSISFKNAPTGPAQEADEFLYIVTHDLKAFVRAMRVIPDWIAEDIAAQGQSLPTDAAANFAMLRDYAQRMDATLDALTELSRVGRISDPAAPHVLHELVETEYAKLGTPSAFSLTVNCNGIRVLGPENDLRRVFAAVLKNAIDHHDRKEGLIEVTAFADGARVRVTVQDDGPGIPATQYDAVFKPLATLKPKSDTGNTGLGLAIARKVVRSLGGDIRMAESQPARGLALAFDLPMAP